MTLRPRSRGWSRFAWLAVACPIACLGGCEATADSTTTDPDNPPVLFAGGSPDVVISQIYGGGGNSGAQFTHDFVELFNRGASSVSITGWSVQYASATGNSWAKANLTGTIPAGGYYLVSLAAGTTTSGTLPTADATGTMNMSGSTGTVALTTNQTLLTCGGSTACLPNAAIHDFVGYGSSALQFEGSGAAPTTTNSTAGFRASSGCVDTDVNSADFSNAAPAPRNSASAHHTCTGTGGGGGTDAGVPDAPSGGSTGDGTPTRQACTGSFGSQMTTVFGRLDGFLVAIVPINGSSTCRGDDNHLHLQIRVNGQIQDIAVNTASTSGSPDVDFLQFNAPLKGGAWSEGWHTGQSFDYATSLGVHSGDFTERTPTTLPGIVTSALANANHVSIFTTGFNGTGGDLIHREGSNHDGAIVINPTTSNPSYLLFHFTDQSF